MLHNLQYVWCSFKSMHVSVIEYLARKPWCNEEILDRTKQTFSLQCWKTHSLKALCCPVFPLQPRTPLSLKTSNNLQNHQFICQANFLYFALITGFYLPDYFPLYSFGKKKKKKKKEHYYLHKTNTDWKK